MRNVRKKKKIAVEIDVESGGMQVKNEDGEAIGPEPGEVVVPPGATIVCDAVPYVRVTMPGTRTGSKCSATLGTVCTWVKINGRWYRICTG